MHLYAVVLCRTEQGEQNDSFILSFDVGLGHKNRFRNEMSGILPHEDVPRLCVHFVDLGQNIILIYVFAKLVFFILTLFKLPYMRCWQHIMSEVLRSPILIYPHPRQLQADLQQFSERNRK